MRTTERYSTVPGSVRAILSARAHAVRSTRDTDLRHPPEIQYVVDLVVGKKLVALYEVTNENAFLHRLLADLRRPGVANVRHEGGRESRRPLDPVRAHRLVRRDSLHRALGQHARGIRENHHRKEDVVRDDGHHDVQLELPMLRRNRHGRITADHLEAYLMDHLGDRWVDLSRHDR